MVERQGYRLCQSVLQRGMGLRLKSELFVQALVRRVQASFIDGAAAAYIAKRGDMDAGGIFVRVYQLDGTAGALTIFTHMDGDRRWRVVLPPRTPEADVDAHMAREIKRDPDIWIIDIEDAQGRHFLEEKIDGIWAP